MLLVHFLSRICQYGPQPIPKNNILRLNTCLLIGLWSSTLIKAHSTDILYMVIKVYFCVGTSGLFWLPVCTASAQHNYIIYHRKQEALFCFGQGGSDPAKLVL